MKRCKNEEEFEKDLGGLLNLSYELVNTKIQQLSFLLPSARFQQLEQTYEAARLGQEAFICNGIQMLLLCAHESI